MRRFHRTWLSTSSTVFRSPAASKLARKDGDRRDPFAVIRNRGDADVRLRGGGGGESRDAERTRIREQAHRLIQTAQKERVPGIARYVSRLNAVISPISGPDLTDLEEEVKQEMASALGRSGEKVDAAYIAYRLAEHRASKDVHNVELKRAAEDAREAAMAARQALVVHRSAMGLVGVGKIFEIWPNLPRLTSSDLSQEDDHDEARCPRDDCASYWERHDVSRLLRDVRDKGNVTFSTPSTFPKISAWNRPIEYVARQLAEEQPSDPLTFVNDIFRHQRDVHGFALDRFKDMLTSSTTSAAVVDAGPLAAILRGEDVKDGDMRTSRSTHRQPFRSKYDAFRRLHQGKFTRDELSRRWQAYKQSSAFRDHDRLVQVVTREADSESRTARGVDASLEGRRALYDVGVSLRCTFGSFDDVRVWCVRRHPAIHGAESLLHGLHAVVPMPTDRSRIRMRHEYTRGNQALVYHANMALSDFGIRSLTRTVPILTTRGLPERCVALAGGSGVRSLLASILYHIRAFDADEDARDVRLRSQNQMVGYVGDVDAIDTLGRILKIETSSRRHVPLSFEVVPSNATRDRRKVTLWLGKDRVGTWTYGRLRRIMESLTLWHAP